MSTPKEELVKVIYQETGSLMSVAGREDLASALIDQGWIKKSMVDGDTSDGYHTFDELYDHRCLLWINFVNISPHKAFLFKDHFEGWFLLTIETEFGQLSYHCPNKYLHLVTMNERVKIVNNITHKYDGHTAVNVLNRLEQMALCQSTDKIVR